MEPVLDIIDGNSPIERSYAVSMTVKSFKGRKNVEVHLFRHIWTDKEIEELNIENLFGPPLLEETEINPEKDKQIILEAFTADERDQVISYLTTHYSSRLSKITSNPMEFPIPAGLPPLSSISEGKDIGLIKFEKVPHFNLNFSLRGLYNLSVHKPLIETRDK